VGLSAVRAKRAGVSSSCSMSSLRLLRREVRESSASWITTRVCTDSRRGPNESAPDRDSDGRHLSPPATVLNQGGNPASQSGRTYRFLNGENDSTPAAGAIHEKLRNSHEIFPHPVRFQNHFCHTCDRASSRYGEWLATQGLD